MSHEHAFIQSAIQGYEVCSDCGSFHSTQLKPQKTLYEDEDYWSYECGHSKPEEQVLNLQCTDDCGISKADRMLQFLPQKGVDTTPMALEIGAFPGVLANKVLSLGWNCIAIEPAEKYIDFLSMNMKGGVVLNGYFPKVTNWMPQGSINAILAMDVFEHIDDYDSFISEAHRLLDYDGVLIMMSPVILDDGFVRDRDFSPSEHAWIFTKKFLEPYLKTYFSEVKFSRWIVGHEIITAKK